MKEINVKREISTNKTIHKHKRQTTLTKRNEKCFTDGNWVGITRSFEIKRKKTSDFSGNEKYKRNII